jgi:putative transposase
MISQKTLPVRHACSSVNVSKSAYYQVLKRPLINLGDRILRSAIYDISLEYSQYGYRRITAELHRRGHIANHKKVLRIMRDENLLCRPKKKFRLTTTDSKHGYPVYPNLAKDAVLTGINQLWVADITYVHLQSDCVYLAVIIDVFSRRCIGWSLKRHIDASLVMTALDIAIDARKELGINELMHHSDQGVQYACNEYVDRLNEFGIKISMSRRGNPYDNAYAESFMKTIKAEEVYLKEYKTFEDAYCNIKQFIDVVYNNKRLHSSIGYLPPGEFEAKILNISLS